MLQTVKLASGAPEPINVMALAPGQGGAGQGGAGVLVRVEWNSKCVAQHVVKRLARPVTGRPRTCTNRWGLPVPVGYASFFPRAPLPAGEALAPAPQHLDCQSQIFHHHRNSTAFSVKEHT